MSDEKNTERVKGWLSEIGIGNNRTNSTRNSVATSETCTEYFEQASGTRDTQSYLVNEVQVDFDSGSSDSRDSTPSIYSQASTFSSIESQRNKTLSKLTGSSKTTSLRSESQRTSQPFPKSHDPSSKYVPNHVVNVHLPEQTESITDADSQMSPRIESTGLTELPQRSTRESEHFLLPQRVKQHEPYLPLEDKHKSAVKRMRKPGPATVNRNSAGKLQFERSKSGTALGTSEKSSRRKLAEYIVGNYY